MRSTFQVRIMQPQQQGTAAYSTAAGPSAMPVPQAPSLPRGPPPVPPMGARPSPRSASGGYAIPQQGVPPMGAPPYGAPPMGGPPGHAGPGPHRGGPPQRGGGRLPLTVTVPRPPWGDRRGGRTGHRPALRTACTPATPRLSLRGERGVTGAASPTVACRGGRRGRSPIPEGRTKRRHRERLRCITVVGVGTHRSTRGCRPCPLCPHPQVRQGTALSGGTLTVVTQARTSRGQAPIRVRGVAMRRISRGPAGAEGDIGPMAGVLGRRQVGSSRWGPAQSGPGTGHLLSL